MGKVLKYRKRDQFDGERLCSKGFHHWEVLDPGPYDAVGRTTLTWRCARCGAVCEGPTPGVWPGTGAKP